MPISSTPIAQRSIPDHNLSVRSSRWSFFYVKKVTDVDEGHC
jgi:hypothetical protein